MSGAVQPAPLRLALGPILYYWPRERVEAFYAQVANWPVDIVYLGETVCARRRALAPGDWLNLADALAAAGKEVVLSSLALIEAESELAVLKRLCDNGRYAVEANDMGAVDLLAGTRGFVAGPHLNVYNVESLLLLASLGAERWVPPVELSLATVAEIQRQRPAELATEVFAFGHLPLAFSARCFTARALDRSKDDCDFRCLDYPEGMPLRTQEAESLFVVNGIQIQSALPCNLLGSVSRLQALNVDVLRISPLAEGTESVVAAFRQVLDGRADAAAANASLAGLAPRGWCNGYADGAPGMVWDEEAAAL